MGNIDTLDIMFKESADNGRTMSPLSAVVGFVVASLVGGVLMAGLVAPVAIPLAVAPEVGQAYWSSLPTELPEVPLPQRSHIYDSQGKRIATFYSENRIEVPLDKVSSHVVDALISTEDARFYSHQGVDWKGVGRALRNNIVSGDIDEGASTITQQLVKNTLILAAKSPDEQEAATEKTPSRKLEEIRLATALEDKYSKDEILERYLNTVLFSNGVYGIGTAAQYYFDTPVEDLNVAQSALLVGLLKSPSAYNPTTSPEAAVARRSVVIGRMVTTGAITQEQADEANGAGLDLDVTKTPNGCGESDYPFYCQWVVDGLPDDLRLGATREDRLARLHLGGLKVTTALDPALQDQAQEDVDSMVGRDNRVAIGVATVEPGTGKVVAMVQNRSWGEGVDENGNRRTQIVLPATTSFQPGSSFKPVTLAAALESGFPPNATMFAPPVFNPSNMNVPKGGIKNLDSRASGPLSINDAMAISSNTYFAKLQYRIGTLNVASMARNLGISVPSTVTSRDASFTLGTTDSSPLQMAAAYAAFAAEGQYCAPLGVVKITSALGGVNDDVPSNCKQAMSKGTATTVTKSLVSVIDGNRKDRTGEEASIGRTAAGKTGTTDHHAAAWFVGYTPQLSTAVWLGDPRGGFKYPLSGGMRFNGRWVSSVFASDIASPAWKRIMENATSNLPPQKFSLGSGTVSSSPTVIPDVRGMTTKAAVETLTTQGFDVTFSQETHKESDEYSSDQVVAQTPSSGERVYNVSGVEIEVTLSHGSTIPEVVN